MKTGAGGLTPLRPPLRYLTNKSVSEKHLVFLHQPDAGDLYGLLCVRVVKSPARQHLHAKGRGTWQERSLDGLARHCLPSSILTLKMSFHAAPWSRSSTATASFHGSMALTKVRSD